jgi:hypothetical protein
MARKIDTGEVTNRRPVHGSRVAPLMGSVKAAHDRDNARARGSSGPGNTAPGRAKRNQ